MQQQKIKTTNVRKPTSRALVTEKHLPQQAHREATREKEVRDPKAPVFLPCSLKGPDGQTRPGWEMWVGDLLFGRADTKEGLLQYYTRLHEPMPSGHWKDRTWQGAPKGPRRQRAAQYESYEDDLLFESEQVGLWD